MPRRATCNSCGVRREVNYLCDRSKYTCRDCKREAKARSTQDGLFVILDSRGNEIYFGVHEYTALVLWTAGRWWGRGSTREEATQFAESKMQRAREGKFD